MSDFSSDFAFSNDFGFHLPTWRILLAAPACAAFGVFAFVSLLSVLRQRQKDKILSRLLGSENADEVLGDLDEVYLKDRVLRGTAYARRRYNLELLKLITRRVWKSAISLAFRRRA